MMISAREWREFERVRESSRERVESREGNKREKRAGTRRDLVEV
jgi:hypothetical protein